MDTPDEAAYRVLECANRVAGTRLALPPDGDVPLEAFDFDSLTLFAFMLELERACGLPFDKALHHPDAANSIRSVAALVTASGAA